ncbi:MAG: aminoacetone oxidase family FAD-binding enzyme [Proteobacteria bacterium]|nr:aminoacetone oxidase family FAD-binding enzyme [Pseudomonadota bacterium]
MNDTAVKSNAADFDVIIVGAGASGLMCAIHAGRRGRKVLLLEKGPKPGLKILVSGGGRCNFTNLWADPQAHYLSANEHFCISAMRRYGSADFIDMVNAYGIAYHEKKLGQLFCDHSARDIVDMLLAEADKVGVVLSLNSEVTSIRPVADGYEIHTAALKSAAQKVNSSQRVRSVVLASGGLSMPKIASDLAYRTAAQLHMRVVSPSPALVPLTWNNADRLLLAQLSGVAIDSMVSAGGQAFRENLLFTHRGLSGPAILQASSYWRPGDPVEINLLPDLDLASWLAAQQQQRPKALVSTTLKAVLPNRFVDAVANQWFRDQTLGSLSNVQRQQIVSAFTQWIFKPGGSEGYRTAEVTLGGICTEEFSSKTFEAKRYQGFYAIGEALDVTGWLGGYNFQWAWASGYCCAQYL